MTPATLSISFGSSTSGGIGASSIGGLVACGQVEQRVGLPMQRAVDELARLEVGMRRSDHLADAPRPHHLADGHGWHVGADVVEPASLGRLERQPQRAHEHLAGAGSGDGSLDELEAVVGDDAGGAGPEHELLVHVVAHLDHLVESRSAVATESYTYTS